MHDRHLAIVAGSVALALVASTGCVTKKTFRKNVEETNSRVASVESGVEANEKRVSDLKADTDVRIQRAQETGVQAMSKAETAQSTADQALRGKLLWTVTLSDDRVKFPFNAAKLPSEATAALDDLASKVKGYGKALYLEIEGHTDSAGPDAYNYELGEKRAQAVRNYLNEHGQIPLHAMNVISFGETKPVVENTSRDNRSQNRRVVIRVLE